MPTLTPGQTLDRYVIVKFIANGGMGEVYHARHKVMGSDVALKLVFRHLVPEPAIVERFLREVQAVARLNHGHIVRVYDAGEAGGEYFMAMEYLPGGSLAAELRELHEARQQMPIPKAVEITRQIALALDYAHRVGFSHRDVKPGNILKRSATEYVLTGFGIVLDEAAARLTNTGWGMGTPTYVPPEQWNGNAVPQSDIYALGITLYEMLVGDVPLRATAPSALMNKHMTEQPSRVLVSRPDVPSGLQHVLDIALAKKSEDRFQSGADFAVALAQVMPPSSALPRPVTIEKAFAFMANPTPPRLVDPSPISPQRVGPAEATIGSNVPPAQRSMSRRTVISLMGGAGALGLGCKVSGTLFKQPPPALLTPASTATPFAIPTLSRATFALAQGVNIDFVRVPAGVFLMGSDGIVSGPRHFVTLPEYWSAGLMSLLPSSQRS